MKFRIPLAKPEITDSDREAALDVLRTPHLSSGPKVQQFEQAICNYTGAKFAVAVNSGTSALQLAVRALNLEPGSEVILPSFTFSALLNVVLQERLQPRFVDIDRNTFNATPELIAATITEKTRLVIAVHTFGVPLDISTIISKVKAFSKSRHTIYVIEDACEALGAESDGRKVGAFGDAGLFAFYPNKQITTGEGGMLITSDPRLAGQARVLRNQGRDGALDWRDHAEVGFSYRLSDINCTLGISQLNRVDEIIERRQHLAEAYDSRLRSLPDIVRPPLRTTVGRISWFVYPVRLAESFGRADRDRVCEFLAQRGIATGRYFAPLHQQPLFAKLNLQSPALPNTEFVADRIIALPFFNEIATAEIDEVCTALREAIHARRKT
jgi:perosamine synthetase